MKANGISALNSYTNPTQSRHAALTGLSSHSSPWISTIRCRSCSIGTTMGVSTFLLRETSGSALPINLRAARTGCSK